MKYASLTWVSMVLILSLNTTANAFEIHLGQGDFSLDGGIAPIADAHFSLPTTTIALAEPHHTLFSSPFFLGFNLDYFSSDSLNRLTDLASTPLTTPLPGFGGSITDQVADYSRIPVPADYRIHGTNADLYLGYDLFKSPHTRLAAGINTGISMPFMETRNMHSDANLAIKLLDSFDTRVRSYKLGPFFSIDWQGAAWLTLSGRWIINRQTGSLKNGGLESDFDIDGSYQSLALSLRFFPARKYAHLPVPASSFVMLGWQQEQWRFDRASIKVPGFTATTPPQLDFSFDHQRLYLGAGVKF